METKGSALSTLQHVDIILCKLRSLWNRHASEPSHWWYCILLQCAKSKKKNVFHVWQVQQLTKYPKWIFSCLFGFL